MRALTALFLLSFSGLAHADPDLQEKICIINAAAKLPPIPGMEIIASRASAINAAKIRRVEFDVRAAGVAATLVYSCAPGVIVLEGVAK